MATRSREQCLQWLRENPRQIAPGKRVQVDRFAPDDAEGVARLYYAIYGEGFAVDYVYDPERIRAHNAGPDLHQMVARTEDGEIVGLSALFRAAPGAGILEVGGLMLLPEYRGGKTALLLAIRSFEMARDELGLNVLFGQCVTDHLVTQKLNVRFGFSSLALEVEAMPPRPGGTGERISLLDDFVIFHDSPHEVHLPEVYEAFLLENYNKLGCERRFLPPGEVASKSVWQSENLQSASLVKTELTTIGKDFAEIVQDVACSHPESHAWQLFLPLCDPGLPAAVEQARALGYGLGGLLPLWHDHDVLLLQKVRGAPDYEAVKLLGDRSHWLFDFVRCDLERVRTD